MFNRKYCDIIKIENLLEAWQCFLRGKRRKGDVIIFQAKLADNLAKLWRELAGHAYEHGPYSAFKISDPKPRDIHKASVRDRLLHHLIFKELCPYFDRKLIYDSYSCRENKGIHRALDRFSCFAGKASKNNTRTCWILKCDIKKFFASIDHKTLMDIIKRNIGDADIIRLLGKVISSFCSSCGGAGLPLGNITSQLFANVYLHEFDMYLKQELRVKYYIRYADDFVILSDNKRYLNDLLPKISEFLQRKLKLELHRRKIVIKTFASGVDFLGWTHFPHHRQIRTATKCRIIKRLQGYRDPQAEISYRGLLGHGNTFKMQKKLFCKTQA